jgi:iron complex transport system substrate-binding protein
VRSTLRFMLAVVLLGAAGCSTTAATTTTAPTIDAAAFPVTVRSDAGAVTVPTEPHRIAALSATHVEMLYAIGAGAAVLAGDVNSDYPPDTDRLTKIDAFNLNVEAVIALDPDLVVLSYDPGEAVAALEAVGIPTVLFTTAESVEDVYQEIEVLGAATGHLAESAALVVSLRSDLEAIVAGFGDHGSGLSYYYETDPFSYYTPNSSTFVGRLLGRLGMENIADAAPDEFGSGFPQLTAEFIVDADPDVILLATAGEDRETLAARDGWDTMTAVREGRVIVLDPDVASRWGPRITDLLQAVADGVAGTM